MTEAIQDDILNQVIGADGKLKPGFCGIGTLRGKTAYTEDEKTVLSHFFTNTHSNIYCATDNMPNELWALVMGQYARSNVTARDRLLKLFEDMHEKEGEASIKELAAMIRSGKDVASMLQGHLRKAGSFVERWGVKYGHASLRDSGTIRICFEGVSQRATKFLEKAREGAYQEQSTRALPFRMENIGIPYELQGTEYETMLLELDEKLIKLYDKIYDKALAHLNEKFVHLRVEADERIAKETGIPEAKLSDREWDGIIASKAFDIARYLLPQNITCSLGMTLNTRRFQDMLTEWRSSHILEIQALGLAAQAESMKISPQLMKYGNPSDYHAKVPVAARAAFRKHVEGHKIGAGFKYKHYDVVSRMVHAPDDLQELVLASILLNGSDGKRSFEELKEIVKQMSYEEKREVAEAAAAGKKPYEIFSKAMECGAVVFERLYDIGAFRDLQRQRGDRQQYNRYSVIGYNMPKEVEEMGFGQEFKELMEEVRKAHDTLIEEGLYGAAEYTPVMANVLRHVVTKDPVQCFYEAKLRTVPAGIDSYRSIAQQEIEQLLGILPVFKGLVEYDPKYYQLGRLPETTRMCIDRWTKKTKNA